MKFTLKSFKLFATQTELAQQEIQNIEDAMRVVQQRAQQHRILADIYETGLVDLRNFGRAEVPTLQHSVPSLHKVSATSRG